MSESDRWIRVAQELSGRVGEALGDAIPADARNHLLNAQRELLTALILIYEHQAGARRPEPPPRRGRSHAADDDDGGDDGEDGGDQPEEPRVRVRKIDIE